MPAVAAVVKCLVGVLLFLVGVSPIYEAERHAIDRNRFPGTTDTGSPWTGPLARRVVLHLLPAKVFYLSHLLGKRYDDLRANETNPVVKAQMDLVSKAFPQHAQWLVFGVYPDPEPYPLRAVLRHQVDLVVKALHGRRSQWLMVGIAALALTHLLRPHRPRSSRRRTAKGAARKDAPATLKRRASAPGSLAAAADAAAVCKGTPPHKQGPGKASIPGQAACVAGEEGHHRRLFFGCASRGAMGHLVRDLESGSDSEQRDSEQRDSEPEARRGDTWLRRLAAQLGAL